MPTDKEKKQIRRLASQGKSVNYIYTKMQLPKSSVYYHFKKEAGQKQKENALKIPDDPEFHGELCGIFAGDGNYFYDTKKGEYRIRFFLNYNYRYWKILAKYLGNKLNKKPSTYEYPETSKVILNYSSKNLYEFLNDNLHWEEDKTGSICLKSDKECCDKFRIGFLRGLIDTDGYRRSDHRRYVFTSASENLVKNKADILEELGISFTKFKENDPRGYRTKHKIRITGKDVETFSRKIRPRNPKR